MTQPVYLNTELPILERARDPVSRLNLEEKVGLMSHPAHGVSRLGQTKRLK